LVPEAGSQPTRTGEAVLDIQVCSSFQSFELVAKVSILFLFLFVNLRRVSLHSSGRYNFLLFLNIFLVF